MLFVLLCLCRFRLMVACLQLAQFPVLIAFECECLLFRLFLFRQLHMVVDHHVAGLRLAYFKFRLVYEMVIETCDNHYYPK